IDRILSWRVEPQAGARAEAIADKTAEISRGRGEGVGQRPGLTGLKLGDESGVSETLSGGQAYERGVENGRRGLPGQIVVGESLSTPVGDVNIEVPPRLNELIQESVLDDVGLVNVKGMPQPHPTIACIAHLQHCSLPQFSLNTGRPGLHVRRPDVRVDRGDIGVAEGEIREGQRKTEARGEEFESGQWRAQR